MNQHKLDLLKQLIRDRSNREKRILELLADPEKEFTEGWYICVPSCFYSALDIVKTERIQKGQKKSIWTQGSFFSFKEGDLLYDTPEAYRIWSEALQHINLCIQVKDATPVTFSDQSGEKSSGSITLTVFKPNHDRRKIIEVGDITLTQDDFVKLLISGPTDVQERSIIDTTPQG